MYLRTNSYNYLYMQQDRPKLRERETSPKNWWSYIANIGLAKERDYFVENLSMLISNGMPIIGALDAIVEELRIRRMKNIVASIRKDIETGSQVWQALAKTNLFPEYAISLIKLGEASGKFTDNLKVVAIEQEKDRSFKSKLRSAMMYPVFVLSLTVIIGIGIAWFILPKLAAVFSQLKIKLPLITKILIAVGQFLNDYGLYVVPVVILVMATVLFFIFSYSKTKFIGQYILFSTPGLKELLKEVEISRFGYLLGTLLSAGLPINQALDSLSGATEIMRYQKLYAHLRDSVIKGNSFQKSFGTYKNINKLISSPIQQLISIGEQSGSLSATLLKIGQTYEAKSDTTTKNLSIILEPILLVIVWLGVVAVALAVILPIYSLIGGFKAQ
jgi:type IV pilus assembly protein PilC